MHRRLRPEAYAGWVHRNLREGAAYPVNSQATLSTAAAQVNAANLVHGQDTFLLPMAFPEGSPIHPAYGAGHATVAGACVTILKALFDESWLIPNPEVVDAAGNKVAFAGPPLTVGGELNKLALECRYRAESRRRSPAR